MILKIKYSLFYRALTKYQCFSAREKIKKKLEKTKRLSVNGLHGKNSVPVTIE